LLRLILSVLVLVMGAVAWRAACNSNADRSSLENRCYLLFLLALTLVGLNLMSWPLLYLLLQSYVPHWSGVMCIYGVTQIGAGSMGPSRHLPTLLLLLQCTKPLLVFAGGAWFVLYLINRRTRTGALLPRLFVALLPLGAFAVADAAAELAYVAIPKAEEFPSSGCCTVTPRFEQEDWFIPSVWGTAGSAWLYAAYYIGNLGLIAALAWAARPGRGAVGGLELAGLLGAGVLVAGVNGLFLVEIAAPTLLHLPYHRCPYDLIPQAPEAIVAAALFVLGCFALGWAAVARWLGDDPTTRPFAGESVGVLLFLALWGLATSLAMLTVELWLA
jgi:hypothetical protein